MIETEKVRNETRMRKDMKMKRLLDGRWKKSSGHFSNVLHTAFTLVDPVSGKKNC